MARRVFAAAVAALACGIQPATAAPRRWLQEHLLVDTAAVMAWRASWEDPQRTGFQSVLGGGEVNLGLEFADGFTGVLLGTRVLAGTGSGKALGQDQVSYLEATGQLGAQLRIASWVRLQAGVAAGRMWLAVREGLPPELEGPVVVAGGFLRLGADWLPRDNATLLRAFSLWLRVDLDGHPVDATGTMPRSSTALALSLGLRL